MTIVKELNELAKKMTGVNPGARTDAQALDYIEQHYQGGDTPTPTPTSKFDYIIPIGIDLDAMSSGDEIENSNVLEVLNEIKTYLSDEFKSVLIGLFYYDSDGNSCFAINSDIQYYRGLEKINFTTISGNITLSFETNKWKIYKS